MCQRVCASLFQEWRDRFAEYTLPAGLPATLGNNAWGLDAAADIVEHLPGQPFVMLVNVGAVDSAGQNLGATGYLQTVQALDEPLGKLAEACRKNNVLLVITADHGMVFPDAKGKGGHSAEIVCRRAGGTACSSRLHRAGCRGAEPGRPLV